MTQNNTKKGRGNTSVSSMNIRSRRWMLTINNYNENDIEKILTQELYAFQEEEGDNKTKHLQAYIEYKNARTFKSMKKKFPTAHIEKARNRDNSIKYCIKEDTRIGRRWCNIVGFKEVDNIFLRHKPHKWQKEILEIIKEKPDERKIYWYWDKKGGCGKSVFAKHLILKHGALVVGGGKRDILYSVSEWIKKNELTIVILDIARAEFNKISHSSMEKLKNGFFFNSKYESGMCVFNTPHVIVFANAEPEFCMMSSDRWVIREIE